MKAVFLDRSTIDDSIDFSQLNAVVDELKSYSLTQPEQIVERAACFEIIITNKVILDEHTLSNLPNLKLICITATGTNNVDLLAAKKLNIAVANVVGYSTASVAQHVFSYLLSVTNNTYFYQNLNKTKPWSSSEKFCQIDAPINELAGLNLGIVGYGELGHAVANIGKAFAMNILISERADAENVREGRLAFEQVLSLADVISVHCPLTSETQHLFNKNSFKLIKPACIFINTARGPVVNSKDLAEALANGQLAHAIIDVLEIEPPEFNHPLLAKNLTNLTLTHHIAWGSLQAQQRLINSVADNIKLFLSIKPTY